MDVRYTMRSRSFCGVYSDALAAAARVPGLPPAIATALGNVSTSGINVSRINQLAQYVNAVNAASVLTRIRGARRVNVTRIRHRSLLRSPHSKMLQHHPVYLGTRGLESLRVNGQPMRLEIPHAGDNTAGDF
jgi:hypothetical protein